MTHYIAYADYEDKDSDPLFLNPGDEVSTGVTDATWPGWVWAENGAGKKGYVPEEILEPLGDSRYRAKERFDPTVLTLKRGDSLATMRQIHRWHWCQNQRGEQGWVADYLLKSAD